MRSGWRVIIYGARVAKIPFFDMDKLGALGNFCVSVLLRMETISYTSHDQFWHHTRRTSNCGVRDNRQQWSDGCFKHKSSSRADA